MTAAIPRDADGDEVPLIEKWQGQAGCPPPELLLPAQEGVLPDALTNKVRAHVTACPLCAELVAVLDADAVPSEDEVQRIEQRVRFQTRGRARVWWPSVAAAAALFTVAGAAYLAMMVSRPGAPAAPQPSSPAAPPVRQPVLPLTAPALELPPESLTLRSEKPNAYAAALENALTPFSAADYQTAAARLEQVSRDHPRRPHAELYLGVARLMKGSAAEAVAPLEAARSLAPAGSSLHAEATWYLAVALERSGRGAEAAGPLNDLCGGGGPRKAQACEGLKLLSNR